MLFTGALLSLPNALAAEPPSATNQNLISSEVQMQLNYGTSRLRSVVSYGQAQVFMPIDLLWEGRLGLAFGGLFLQVDEDIPYPLFGNFMAEQAYRAWEWSAYFAPRLQLFPNQSELPFNPYVQVPIHLVGSNSDGLFGQRDVNGKIYQVNVGLNFFHFDWVSANVELSYLSYYGRYDVPEFNRFGEPKTMTVIHHIEDALFSFGLVFYLD
ncbi:MAG: lipocalin-like domain-containing protein [Cytophagales bacterium]|nr:lipocalin-like domain-containing protein [Cytophagales bacterium]